MNTKIILAVVLAIIIVAAWAVNAHRNKGFKTVSSEEFAGIISDTVTVQLLDVRTKEEYEEGHIADALLVDFYSYILLSGEVISLSPVLSHVISKNKARHVCKQGVPCLP